jgi:hypothetical protein
MFIACGIRRICTRRLAEFANLNAVSGLVEERQAFEPTTHNVSGGKNVDGVLSKANW